MKNTAALLLRSSKILGIYTRYSELGASSRLRYYLYRKAFSDSGITAVFHPLLKDRYLRRLYAGKGKSKLQAAAALLKRFCNLFALEKNLLIEYELFPYLPAEIELFFIGRRRYVLNFDDLVWEKYKNSPLLAKKFDKLISRAAGVIAANHLLYDKIKTLNNNVILIPTVVDLDHYHRAEIQEKNSLCAAWIGTPVTFKECFIPHADTLKKVCRETNLKILVIARKDLPVIDGISMTCVDWSEEKEAEYLASCDLGIMPLADDDFSRGKSAYKLIQYAATGLPAVASPVGENRYFIRQGENGFCADSADGWIDAVRKLADTDTRRKMSGEMLKTAYDYSLQKYAPEMIRFLIKCFSD